MSASHSLRTRREQLNMLKTKQSIMWCCGQRRDQSHSKIPDQPIIDPSEADVRAEEMRRKGVVYFKYVGSTGMTVLGPMTGKRYRFGWHYAVVAVDLKDAPTFAEVPNLEQLIDR